MSDLETLVRRYAQTTVDEVRPVTAAQIVAIAEQRRRRTMRLFAAAGLAVVALLAVIVQIVLPTGDDLPIYVDTQAPLPSSVLETWGDPHQVHVEDGYAWVAVGPPYDEDGITNPATGGIVRIDLETHELEPWVEVPGMGALAVGHGSLWAHVPVGAELVRIDQRTGAETARIDLPIPDPSPNANREPADYVPAVVYVGDADIWVVAIGLDGYVAHIDPATDRITEINSDLPTEGQAAVEGRHIWLLARRDPEGSVVIRLSADGEVGPTLTPTYEGNQVHTWELAVSDGRIWLAAEYQRSAMEEHGIGLVLAMSADGRVIATAEAPASVYRVDITGDEVFGLFSSMDQLGLVRLPTDARGETEPGTIPLDGSGVFAGWPSSPLWFVTHHGEVATVDPETATVTTFPPRPTVESAGPVANTANDTIIGTRFPVPDRWDASPEYLHDGTPVFVVTDPDGEVRVFDAVDPHHWDAHGGQLLGWCGASGWLEDIHYGSVFAPEGRWTDGPSPHDLSTYPTRRVGDEIELTGAATMSERGSVDRATDPRGPHCGDDGVSDTSFRPHRPIDVAPVEEAARSDRWRWVVVRPTPVDHPNEPGRVETALCPATGECGPSAPRVFHSPPQLADVVPVLVRMSPAGHVEVRWPADPDLEAAGEGMRGLFPVPARGEAEPGYLADGTPVFVVTDREGAVHVVDATLPYRWDDGGRLILWCRTSGLFEELSLGSVFGPSGAYSDGPAESDLAVYHTRIVDGQVEAVGPPVAAPRGSTGSSPRARGRHCVPEHPDFRDRDVVRHRPTDPVSVREAADSTDWRWTEVTVRIDEAGIRLCPARGTCLLRPSIVVATQARTEPDERVSVLLRLGSDGRPELRWPAYRDR